MSLEEFFRLVDEGHIEITKIEENSKDNSVFTIEAKAIQPIHQIYMSFDI
ncbi:hypothetical protein LIP24_10345 [Collinsella aerofaciens]|nr:hypothetical protein [Collinsella aerofaciens]MCB5367032.1 hypothetical protein [Collinsella aerofaciens]